LERHSGDLGQDVIEKMGQLLGGSPAHLGVSSENLVEPSLREAKDRARCDRLKGNRELPTGSGADANGIRPAQIRHCEVPPDTVGDECSKRAGDDDRELGFVEELACGQLDDSNRFGQFTADRTWKYSQEALTERV
jgi:hypothetical protein